METDRGFWVFWVRGIWVFLMIIAINLALGGLSAAVAFLLRSVLPQPIFAAYAVVLFTLGLPFAGWFFEQLAARLPRIRKPG